MLESLATFLQKDTSLEEVVICVLDYRDYAAFKEKLEDL
jgi:hypothetical protein